MSRLVGEVVEVRPVARHCVARTAIPNKAQMRVFDRPVKGKKSQFDVGEKIDF